MHNCAGTDPLVATPDGHGRQLIAADLRSLIEQIEASMRLVETAMMQEAGPAEQPGSADVIVLDDVTPRYLTANAALGACKASLELALKCVSDFGKPLEAGIHPERRPHLLA
jgi:hypothetical protein